MLKSFMQPGTTTPSRTDSNRTSLSGYPTKPAESPKAVEATKQEASKETSQYARNEEGNKLIVGPNIKLKGSEITDCEILVVEGRVEASMNSRDIRIAEGGVFSGKAEIDVAEVRGTFEGELTARKRLVVYATGKVSGTITGNMATHTEGPTLARVPEVSAPATTSEAADEKEPESEPAHSTSVFARGQRRQG